MPADEPPPLGSSLRRRVIEAILRDGPMPVDSFMHVCLADPAEGYWQRAATIGARGDFITAPEISQVFGELIALWCAVTWQAMGAPSPIALIELGPGRGTLMADVLRTLARAAPDLHAGAHVHLVETSAPMRAAQARAVAAWSSTGPSWHSTLADVPDGPAIVLANEFLDALPIRQLVWDSDAWRERLVGCNEAGQLAFVLSDPVPDIPGAAAEAGAILELRPGEDEVFSHLSGRARPMAALFIDYGPSEPAYGDTLQAMRGHAYVDPLAQPGASDITAHVQFASLAQKARTAGFDVSGPITQAEFLGALGLAVRTSRLMSANPGEAAAIEMAAQRLVAPGGMGTLFKVLCARSPGLPDPPPFR